jgi:hypothetical protein
VTVPNMTCRDRKSPTDALCGSRAAIANRSWSRRPAYKIRHSLAGLAIVFVGNSLIVVGVQGLTD